MGYKQCVSMEVVDLGRFARQWAVEGRRIAWLLGAGASAAAGVPTAGQIVVDLLARLYTDAHGLVLQEAKLADPAQREQILSYYDGMNGMPRSGDPGDYSAAFRLAFPDEGPRRQYLRQLLSGRSPCYGQKVLGAFLAQGLADLVITTNFDDLIEQAADQARAALGTPSRPRLGVAALGDPQRAAVAISDNDFPLLVKLHGDFREVELRNLDVELREQDETLRQVVLDSSRRFGLAVVGYSGRDSSVMDTLQAAVCTARALPAGLWWMTRDTRTVLPAVTELLSAAVAAGVPTKLVQIDNFDELLAALAGQAALVAPLRAHIDTLRSRARVTDAAMPTMEAGELPVLRLNALPVLEAPRRALQTRLPDGLDIPAMRDALRATGWRGAAVASGTRVLALGSAGQLAEALGLSSSPIEVPLDCLSQDATTLDRALGYEALTRALARRLPVRAMVRDRGHHLIVRPTSHDQPDSASDATARAALIDAYGPGPDRAHPAQPGSRA